MANPRWRLELKTVPSIEPITTATAKSHLRVTVTDDDTLIDSLVKAAREYAETATRRALITQTWLLKADGFPSLSSDVIYVPLPPLASVTSITYVDTNGDTQTWAASKYDVSAPKGEHAAHGRIALAFGETWPSTRKQIDAVTIEFKAGYGDAASDVPEGIILAMKLLLAHWYDHREAVAHAQTVVEVPLGAKALLHSYRALRFEA
ncbi:hypothetical protein LCGC14_1731390 [marine sediment metagenome]|uniref:Phage gp6-like head-tail connector protein n=1 Tax=marine sediment metagenome TaxID=412755 RepID=A0A0F9H995_9ZZZZ